MSVTGWADDVGTLRRLLDGLRALRSALAPGPRREPPASESLLVN